MGNDPEVYKGIEIAAARFEAIQGLETALDSSYRRFVRAARSEWERRFGGRDASDACVSVRISSEEQSVRGSGFLPARQSAADKTSRKLSLPRFAR